MLFSLGSLHFKLPAEGVWLGLGRKRKIDLLDIFTLGLEVLSSGGREDGGRVNRRPGKLCK